MCHVYFQCVRSIRFLSFVFQLHAPSTRYLCIQVMFPDTRILGSLTLPRIPLKQTCRILRVYACCMSRPTEPRFVSRDCCARSWPVSAAFSPMTALAAAPLAVFVFPLRVILLYARGAVCLSPLTALAVAPKAAFPFLFALFSFWVCFYT